MVVTPIALTGAASRREAGLSRWTRRRHGEDRPAMERFV